MKLLLVLLLLLGILAMPYDLFGGFLVVALSILDLILIKVIE